MQILTTINNGHIASCRSDDGLATATITPFTTLYGEFRLVDQDGNVMWRREYADADGICRGRMVPDHIWQSAVTLMTEWTDYQRAREDETERRILERDLARLSSRGEQIAQDMDDPNSVL